MKILIFGTFDLLHPGHRFVLNEASKRGNLHIVVARDSTVERIKKKKPRQSQEERMDAIRHEFPDVTVHLGDAEDYIKPLQEIRPDLILLGYDQKLPPGITEADLHCKIERLPGFETEKWKSSRL